MKFSTIAVALCVGLASPAYSAAYLSSISGGSAAKPPQGAAFLPRKPAGLNPPPSNPVALSQSEPANAAPTSASYLNQMGGGAAAPVKKASFAPGGGKPYAPTSGSGMGNYLDNVAPPAVPAFYSAQPAAPAASAVPAFNPGQMGGGSAAPVKPASYAPGGGKPYAATRGSGMGNYLDNVAPAASGSQPAAPAPAAPVANTAPTSASYLGQMGGGSAAPVKPASYAPGGGKPYAATRGSGMRNYLDNVAPAAGGSQPAPPAVPAFYSAEPAAPAASAVPAFNPGQVGSVSAAPVKPASYAPGGGKPYAATRGSGMGSYLDNVAPAASGSQPAAPAPAASASFHPGQMGGGSAAPVKPASYAPGGGKPYAATRGSGMGDYLSNVANGAPDAPPTYSVPDPTPSSGPKTSYAPTKSNINPSRGSGMGGYLNNM